MKTSVQPGSQWVYANQLVEVDGPHTLLEVFVRNLATGEHRSVRIDALKPPPDQANEADITHIPERQWRRADQLRRAFQPYCEQTTLPHSAAQEIADSHGLSVRQVQRLRRRFQDGGKTSDLVQRRVGRRSGTRLIAPAVEAVIAQMIERHYACAEPATMAKVAERVRLACVEQGLRPASPETVFARIRALRGADLLAKQRGRKAANQRYAARAGELVAERAMALVQIDHTQVDLQIVDDAGQLLGRPWLTLAIDVCTRAVVGWYLALHAPSSVSVAMCVAHMMCPKPENQATDDLWPMYGRPECILVDNGRDLTSLAFQRGCEQHGIELRWRPMGQPHFGGHIERLMGTIMTEVHELPGTTFSRPHRRGEYASEKRACLTLEDLREWLIDRICRGYHVRPHRGLNGRAPLIAWEQAHRAADGQLMLPALPMGAESLHRDFFPFVMRRLQRTGIQWAGTRYWHPSLAPLVGPDVHLRLHYHPQEPACAWVCLPDGLLVEVFPVAGRAIDGPRHRPDTAEQARTDAILAVGYGRSDAVVAQARRRRRRRGGARQTSATVQVPVQAPATTGVVPVARLQLAVEADAAIDTPPETARSPKVPIERIVLAVEVDE